MIGLNEVLILCTDWAEDYWETDKTAPYPKMSISPVRHLKHSAMIPGIGVYVKGKKADLSSFSPCFIIVKNVEETEKGEPLFQFHFLQSMEGISSAQFIDRIRRQGLFFSLPKEKILAALDRLGIEAPSEWIMLLGKQLPPPWQSWIGEHFLNILKSVSTQEHEDRAAEVFKALGFEVEQMGYRKEGEYPDGIITYSPDFSIVYDCKNCSNYFLDARDKRAMIKYIQDAKRRIKEKLKIEKVYFAIIAHSYDQRTKNLSDIEKETSTKGILLTSETMLYLLFKKLSLGRSFLLTDFEGLISAQTVMMENIDRMYSE
jgi:hypothetical protein